MPGATGKDAVFDGGAIFTCKFGDEERPPPCPPAVFEPGVLWDSTATLPPPRLFSTSSCSSSLTSGGIVTFDLFLAARLLLLLIWALAAAAAAFALERVFLAGLILTSFLLSYILENQHQQ